MVVGTTSKIDWVATCSGYRSLIIMNQETPGIISLFEKLNSQLFSGQVSVEQQDPFPIPESRHPIPFDNTMHAAIAKLQSRVAVSPIQNCAHTPRPTPTLGIGAGTPAQRCVGYLILHDLLLFRQ